MHTERFCMEPAARVDPEDDLYSNNYGNVLKPVSGGWSLFYNSQHEAAEGGWTWGNYGNALKPVSGSWSLFHNNLHEAAEGEQTWGIPKPRESKASDSYFPINNFNDAPRQFRYKGYLYQGWQIIVLVLKRVRPKKADDPFGNARRLADSDSGVAGVGSDVTNRRETSLATLSVRSAHSSDELRLPSSTLLLTEVEDMGSEGICETVGQTTTLGATPGMESKLAAGVMECGGCGERVRERTVLCVGGRTWHSRCLRCCACARPLHDQHSCFLRGMRLYCRHDYALAFGAKCAKCGRSVGPGDWVRRARERVYHLACFACDACSRQLSTGEEFALLDAKLLCKAHYLDVVEGNNTSSDEGGDSESGHKGGNKAKRVRTTFTEEQLSVLQANFQLDSNPDGQDLERIAHVTGLSKRVTQVWFQNSRARQKKHLHTGKMKGQHAHQSPPNSSASPGDFGRHINLHLTYSFQHQQQHQQSQQQTQLSPATCKSPTPSIYHNHGYGVSGSEQSMDELSQDSMMLSMPNEV